MSIIRRIRFLITRSRPVSKCSVLVDELPQAKDKYKISDVEANAYIPGCEDQVSVVCNHENANLIDFYLSTQQGDSARVALSLEDGDCFYTWLTGRSISFELSCTLTKVES